MRCPFQRKAVSSENYEVYSLRRKNHHAEEIRSWVNYQRNNLW